MVKIREDLPTNREGSIDIDSWIQRVTENRDPVDNELLREAATLSLEHAGHNLTPVKISCVRQGLLTAEALLSLEPDIATMLAAILYFPAQYGSLTLEAIKEHFGEDVMVLVAGVKHITEQTSLVKGPHATITHDNLRRMLLAVVEDVRIVLIKLAERITTLRSAHVLDSQTCRQLALETRDIYAPLANRLGIGQIKWELEDFAFRYLEPEAYKHIAKLLDEKRIDREIYVKKVIEVIQSALAKENIEGEIYGRVKHIYSIWRKMNRKNLDFKDIYDVRAIRILVPDIRDCYGALGIVHSLWQHIPHEFDDYIATPKGNGYRSLHTAVIGPEGRTIEIQIRTFDMHQEAELGVAAHWVYKEGAKLDKQYQKKINALRQILDVAEQNKDDSEEILLQEVLEDRIYIFTPRGDIIDLPKGSTPLDFAYQIHSELGHCCRGAKVNGVIVPLTYQLSSGEQLEILSVKQGAPSRDWLNPHLGYLKTARARAKVHNWFKRQDRDKNIIQGKEIFEKECKRSGLEISGLDKILEKYNFKTLDDLYAAIGGGDLRVGQVLTALQRLETPHLESEEILTQTSRHSPSHSEITIQGVGNLLCHFGGCCKPLPGDQIVGFITLGRGITLHRQDCLTLLNRPEDKNRLIDVEWGALKKNVYPVDISIQAYDRQGLLKDITSVLSNDKINLISANTSTNRDENIASMVLTVEVLDLSSLLNILNKIMHLPNVIEAKRLHAAAPSKEPKK